MRPVHFRYVIRDKDDQLKNVLRSLYGDVTLEEGVEDLVDDFFLQGAKTSEAVQCRVPTKPERTVELSSVVIDLKEEVRTLVCFERFKYVYFIIQGTAPSSVEQETTKEAKNALDILTSSTKVNTKLPEAKQQSSYTVF